MTIVVLSRRNLIADLLTTADDEHVGDEDASDVLADTLRTLRRNAVEREIENLTQRAVAGNLRLGGVAADKARFARIEAYRTGFAEISAQGASFAGAEIQRGDFSRAKLTAM